jgi:hypothetical protein
MIKKILINTILLLLILAQESKAEFWVCEDIKSMQSIVTNSPATSNDVICIPFLVSQAAYNKVPSEVFDRYIEDEEYFAHEIKNKVNSLPRTNLEALKPKPTIRGKMHE